jgi:hypothetical protein
MQQGFHPTPIRNATIHITQVRVCQVKPAWRASSNLALVRSIYLRDGSTNSIFGFGSTSGPSRASDSVPK